ncbi:hypothetical protein ACFYKX_20155 [Cytobacillus sp. FJAT-54145]|uniref:Uncharacterized protein n=1 Tax=Cytobacillus spartinae TaxID=3299023 RepID=A0ABW6KGR5_9BACI
MIKRFVLTFLIVYLLTSIPTILGFGYVIDWAVEATVFQKVKVYIVNGLVENFPVKIIIAAIVGFGVILRSKSKGLTNLR